MQAAQLFSFSEGNFLLVDLGGLVVKPLDFKAKEAIDLFREHLSALRLCKNVDAIQAHGALLAKAAATARSGHSQLQRQVAVFQRGAEYPARMLCMVRAVADATEASARLQQQRVRGIGHS